MLKLEKNIFLVGFMGSGKTSLGRALSEILEIDFFDTDELITRMQKMSIADIFSRYGEKFFRDRESEVLEFLGQKEPGTCIISTGGGAVMREKNWMAFNENGTVIYLDITVEEVYRRLKKTEDRPIIKPILKLENPLEKIEELLKERKPYYARADIIVDATGKSPQKIAAEVINVLGNNM